MKLTWETLPPGINGATDGSSAIWMEPDQLQVERRCTLAHELCHVDLGHDTTPTVAEETKARHCAARRLIDWDGLVDAFRWSDSVTEAAEELWVTEAVFMDRIHGLSAAERALLRLITSTR